MYKFVRQSYIGEVDIWDVVAHSPEVVLPAYVLRLHLDPEERSSMFLRNFVQLENFTVTAVRTKNPTYHCSYF